MTKEYETIAALWHSFYELMSARNPENVSMEDVAPGLPGTGGHTVSTKTSTVSLTISYDSTNQPTFSLLIAIHDDQDNERLIDLYFTGSRRKKIQILDRLSAFASSILCKRQEKRMRTVFISVINSSAV
jgi:hypothetical protein